MFLQEGAKLLVCHRRLFAEDQPRFFVGVVEACDGPLAKVSGFSWTRDASRGYVRKDDRRTKIVSLGSGSVIVYELPAEEAERGIRFGATPTADGRKLVIERWDPRTRHTEIWWKDLSRRDNAFQPLITGFDAQYEFIESAGNFFWVRTTAGAPNWRVVTIDAREPQRDRWRELIPEAPEALTEVSVVGTHLVASYLVDARAEVRVHDLEGQLVRTVALPGPGSARG